MATILVLDDNAGLLAVAATSLAADGHRVLTAETALDALATLRQAAVDLLVTDVVMPAMNGFVVAHAARAERPGLRVLYTSAYSELIPAGEGGRRYGPLLQKPWRVDDLRQAVREALATDPLEEEAGR